MISSVLNSIFAAITAANSALVSKAYVVGAIPDTTDEVIYTRVVFANQTSRAEFAGLRTQFNVDTFIASIESYRYSCKVEYYDEVLSDAGNYVGFGINLVLTRHNL